VQVLRDRQRPVSERLAAVPMLEHLPKKEAVEFVGPLLDQREPLEVQKALLGALNRMDRSLAAPLLYTHLPQLSGTARAGALQYLQRDPLELLQKIKAGALNPALVDATTRWRFSNSKSAAVSALAQEIFGATEGDRKKIVKRYSNAVAGLQGNVSEGREVFLQACAACHQFRGEGIDFGPDLSDVRIKLPEMLLADILDPNAAIEPRWEAFSVTAQGGRTLVGFIESENNEAIMMKGPGWKEAVPRTTLEASEPLGISLMPEGLEGSITEQQMSSLLDFLRSLPERR
jgi:putative heme-binding domain-containing protein